MEKVIIIGSGPAGLTAALYSARANLNPLVIEGAQSGGIAGGQLMTAGKVENFPALPDHPEGPKLVSLMRQQVQAYQLRFVQADVIQANLQSRPFTIVCSNRQQFETHSLIIATGSIARRLPLESEKKYWGRGISACAVCDGALPIFRNQTLAVIGGGDSAAEDALHLTQFGLKVLLIHRRNKLRASRIMQDRVLNNARIEIFWNTTVVEFLGNGFLSALRLKDELTGAISEAKVRGAFEAIGFLPNTKFIMNQLELDDTGYIRCQPESTVTSVEGVFSAGDVADRKYRQAITAAGSGCKAAMDAEHWLHEKDLL